MSARGEGGLRRRWRRFFRPDFAVDRGTASGMLVAIVAIVTLLGALAVAAGHAVSVAVAARTADLTGGVTVELPGGNDAAQRAVLTIVRADPAVRSAEPLPRDQVIALLEPLIGPAARTPDLPIPALIDVALRPGAAFDARALETRLRAAAPGVRVDDHAALRDGLARLSFIALSGAAGILALIAAVAAGAVIFATHTGIAVHRDAIELLHHIGASDPYVARQFAFHAGAIGALGGLIGLFLAVLVLLVLDQSLPHLQAFGDWPPAATLDNLLRFAALPPLAGLLAMATAWRTVMRALGRLM